MSRSKANGSMFSNRSRSISRWDRLKASTPARSSLVRLCPESGSPEISDSRYSSPRSSQTVSLPVPLDELAIQKTLEPVVEEVLDDGFLPHVGMTDHEVTPPRQQIATAGVGLDLNDLEEFAHALLKIDPPFRRPEL